jgi:hypothetical protein
MIYFNICTTAKLIKEIKCMQAIKETNNCSVNMPQQIAPMLLQINNSKYVSQAKGSLDRNTDFIKQTNKFCRKL